MATIRNDVKPFMGSMNAFPWSGKLLDMSTDEYFADTLRLSQSMLREGYRNPEMLGMMFAGWRNPANDTSATGFGRAFHMGLLEPDRYNDSYLILDDTVKCQEIGGAKPRSTNAYKEWINTVHNEASRTKRTVMSLEDHVKVQAMVDRVMSIPELRQYLDYTMKEVKLVGNHLQTDVKGMIDATDGLEFILDLKKINLGPGYKGLSPEALDSYIDQMDYDAQQWSYLNLIGVQDSFLLFVSDEMPFTPVLVRLSGSTLQRGRMKYEAMLRDANTHYDLSKGTRRREPFYITMSI
jgi:hypothetical protein